MGKLWGTRVRETVGEWGTSKYYKEGRQVAWTWNENERELAFFGATIVGVNKNTQEND
jgi:hypothetical protein